MQNKRKLTSSQLQRFQWYGSNQLGKKQRGVIFAKNKMDAQAQLKQQRIRVKRLKQGNLSSLSRLKHKIKPKDITALTRQLATMLSSGIPIIQAIKMIISTQTSIEIKAVLSQVCSQVEAGSSLSESMRAYPILFNDFYCDFVVTGEQTGKLHQVFDRLGHYREKTEQLKNKVTTAMIYPAMVILVASVISILMLTTVIPEFEAMFTNMGAELPWFTQQVINTSHYIQHYSLSITLTCFLVIIVSKLAIKKSLRFRLIVTQLLLNAPILGPILAKSAIAKFSRTLATSFTAGIPILNSLLNASKTSDNLHYQLAIEAIQQDVSSGTPIHVAIRNTQAFPEMVIQMIMIGEESGKLDDMLNRVASMYEAEIDNTIDNLGKMIEPLIIIFLGVLVGGLVVSLYLPIFNMAGVF